MVVQNANIARNETEDEPEEVIAGTPEVQEGSEDAAMGSEDELVS
jgi:hypothetical protein